jgi:hypothetical protein
MMFAAWIWALGRKEPGCIGGVDFETDTSYVDAFILSWTTFSTVVRQSKRTIRAAIVHASFVI